ncbi:hypothetical protein OAO01_02760 [Oligoflexia bacterium]|nr:hypothetical protein [Oligoflexia bacterium]
MAELNDKDQKFYDTMEVPAPTQSPNEMIRHLMAFRNEWKLYRRKCDFTNETIISAYRADVPFPVYKYEVWWGDDWDPLEYGTDFDFTRPFFEQFGELQGVVPREGTSVFHSENCDYNGHIRESKNCYMNSLVHKCEDTHFCYWVVNNKDVLDCVKVNDSTLAYECVDCEGVYECVALQEGVNCHNCYFCYQLRGCSNCIGCSNLTNKEYYAFNKPLSKAEFIELKQSLLNGSYSAWQKGRELFATVLAEAKHRCVHNLNCENVVGDHLIDCKNCHMSFDGFGSEDVKHSVSFSESADIYHCYSAGWPRCELVFNSAVTRASTNIAFCYYTFYSSDLRYCDSSMSCHDCFGCIGLKQKRYCILNKEYGKEEYFELRNKIIEHMKSTGEWGQFFPKQLSTFAYNETAAQDFFPLSQADIRAHGWQWHDIPSGFEYDGPQYDLPDAINDVTDDICSQVLTCEATGKHYRLTTQEVEFYRKMELPIPRLAPEARHQRRYARRTPHKIFERQCSETGEKIFSSFAPERTETVLSPEAYLRSLD